MWPPSYFATGHWTGVYWPPGAGIPVPLPVHPHAIVTVDTSRTFHMEWLDSATPPSILTAPAPSVASRRSVARVSAKKPMVTSTRSATTVTQVQGSTVQTSSSHTGGTQTAQQSGAELSVSHEAATDVEVGDG